MTIIYATLILKKISNLLYLYIFVSSVWKEWVIVNNTFEAMLFANGDMCPGEKPRQTKVYTGYHTLQAEPERDKEKVHKRGSVCRRIQPQHAQQMNCNQY